MDKYSLYKVFKYRDIPEVLIKPFNIKLGHTIMLIVDKNGLNPTISDWFIKNGALDKERVFVFHE